MDKKTLVKFKAAGERIAPLFLVITAMVYVYVWKKSPGLVEFMDNIFPYHGTVLIAHAAIAYAAAKRGPGGAGVDGGEQGWAEDWDPMAIVDTNDNAGDNSPQFNPANGLLMLDDCVDIEGNMYGTDSD